MGLLDGKVAIVTGAGRGIGRGEALALAAAGAHVVVNDLDESLAQQVVDDIAETGGSAQPADGDVSTWDGARDLVAQAVDAYGRLDILVNNAGNLRDKMSFNMTEEDWDAVMGVHLKGHFAMAHFAANHWRARAKAGEQTSGRIINTTSEAGLFGNPGQANYAAAKAGIAALTVVLARELERYGVTANAIAPRARTRMTEEIFASLEQVEGQFDLADPENVAPLVAWLASDTASHVSGQVFVVWGGAVQLVRSWEVIGMIDAGNRRWEPEELIDATKELFVRREPGVPKFGVPMAE